MKSATLSITLSAVLIVCLLVRPGNIATAQDYDIRVDSPVNLRASYSTEADVAAIVPSNTALKVIGRFNRWLKISYQGRQVWLADWVNHTRLDNAPTPPAVNQVYATQEPIDNYCFTTWNCTTEVDWVRGWEAWQRSPYGDVSQYEPTPTDWDSDPQPSPTPSLDWWDSALGAVPPASTPYFDSTPIFPDGWDCGVVPPSEFYAMSGIWLGYYYCSPTPTAKQLATITYGGDGEDTIRSVDLEPGIYEITFLIDIENTREGKVEVMNKSCFASRNSVILHNLSPIPRPYNMVGSRWHTDNLRVDYSCRTDIKISNIVGGWELDIVPHM